MKIFRPPAAPPARPTARGSFRLGSAPMKREPIQVKRRKKSTCRKSIFILNSALTTKLPLELAYRDAHCPAPKNVGPQNTGFSRRPAFRGPKRELLALPDSDS